MAALILFLALLALIAGLASAAEVAVFALANQTVEELAARGGLRARRLGNRYVLAMRDGGCFNSLYCRSWRNAGCRLQHVPDGAVASNTIACCDIAQLKPFDMR